MQQFADYFNTFGIAFDSNRFTVKRLKRLNIWQAWRYKRYGKKLIISWIYVAP